MERLDKIISNMGYGSRKDVKKIIKDGRVKVDGVVIKDNNKQVDPEKTKIVINGEEVFYKKYIYLMLNKPAGVISATFDNYDKTVIDLLNVEDQMFEPFPIGRLDKDTVGLLFLTNDGDFNHRLISPKWHVDKIYYAKINEKVTDEDVEAFKEGIVLDDGYKCMSADLKVLNSDKEYEVEVIVREGKYHQVKRMFEARGKKVIYLKRISFAGIDLDEKLKEGEYRELTEEEMKIIREKIKM
ncbi:pseudouridine synthase [Clostridium felsineum]|uniref:pseudouridine synthase n=1 Tax=Clostridium felsineum TaxID=36839 RepID=UPI00098C6ABF|nr:pseudouridine synthase [Clostridium felsineum]URZ15385.1 Ribosomal large subunit pseudouridine synthase B [Clostridium felsineum DSM 794]